jgi:hypothetical protein
MAQENNQQSNSRNTEEKATAESKKITRGRITLLVILILIGLGYMFREKDKILTYLPGSEAKCLISSSAAPEFKRLHARLITDVTDLGNPSWRNPLISLAHFKPDGATFPDGVQISMPLAESRDPGSTLWIVFRDVKKEKWYGTGESARVNSDGRSAVGSVYHFSYIGLVDKPLKRLEEAHVRRPANLYIPEVKLTEFQKMINENVRTANKVLEGKSETDSPQLQQTTETDESIGSIEPSPARQESVPAASGKKPPPEDLGDL